MRIEIAKHAGYCYGVERALKLTKEAALSLPKPIFTLGPIIHNPQVVDSLKKKGVYPVDGVEEIKEGTIIVRSHGIDPQVIKEVKRQGIKVVDATCPFVKKAQQCAAMLREEGYNLIIVGERNHPEVIGILAYAGGKAFVVEQVSELPTLTKQRKVGIVVQTTQSEENLKKIVAKILPQVSEVKVYNTICDATSKRQKVARELARKANVMLVIGGKNSANTTRLAQICRETNPYIYHIETASELQPSWFKDIAIVGVTAGASTPHWILEEVVDRLSKLNQSS